MLNIRTALVVLAVLTVAVGFAIAADNQHTTGKNGGPLNQGPGHTVVKYDSPKQVPDASRADTIQYDTGAANAFVVTGPSRSVGNRFNSANGNPLPGGGQLTQVQWMEGGADGGQYLSFYGPPNTAGTASVLGATFFTGVVVGLNTRTMSYSVGSDFLIGVLNAVTGTTPLEAGPTSIDHVDLDSGNTVGGQGYHAMSIGSTWYPSGYTDIPNMNAIIRATGTNLPVELQVFSIE